MWDLAFSETRWSKFRDGCFGLYSDPANHTISLGDAEEVLLKSGLIDKSADSSVLSIHRLIQAVVMRNQTDPEKSQNFEAVVCTLSWGFPNTWSEDVGHQFRAWEKCEKCLPHVHHLVGQRNHYQITLDNPQRYGELLLRCSW